MNYNTLAAPNFTDMHFGKHVVTPLTAISYLSHSSSLYRDLLIIEGVIDFPKSVHFFLLSICFFHKFQFLFIRSL